MILTRNFSYHKRLFGNKFLSAMFLWRAPKVVWNCWGPWLWPWGLSLLFKEGTSPPRSVSLPPWPGYTWCVFIWWTYELRQQKQKQQNAQIQFAKCAPWRVHFELYGKKDKETKKGKLQKKTKEDFGWEQLARKVCINCQRCLWPKHKLSNPPWEKVITELYS